MMWTQLVYGTIVLANLNVGTPQFYTGASRSITAADIIEIVEATQERCAATNGSVLFSTNKLSGVSYKVDQYDYWHWADYTQTWYSATGSYFTAWSFSLIGQPQYGNAAGLPPVLDWRLSRMLLNRCVRRISDCAPRYVASIDPIVTYTSNTIWTAAGSTNGAPNFGLFLSTAKVWQVFRALRAMNKTAVIPQAISTSQNSLWTNSIAGEEFNSTNATRPDWMDDPNLIPDIIGAPTVTLAEGLHTNLSGGTESDTLTVKGPMDVVLGGYDPPLDGNYWYAEVRFVFPETFGYDLARQTAYRVHSYSGIVDFANMGAGVVCSGRLSMAVAITGTGGVTNETHASLSPWWSITHTGVSTGKAGRAVWAEPIAVSNFVDLAGIVSTGHWGEVSDAIALADPCASLSASMTVTPTNSIIYWTFLRCTNGP